MEKSLNQTPEEMKATVEVVFEGLKEGPPRAPGNDMLPNDMEHPNIIHVLTSEGMDLVFRAIWLAKICRLESVVSRTAAILLIIKNYGGGAIILQEILEQYTGADTNEQFCAIKELSAAELNPEVKIGLQAALKLMHDYCHLKCDGQKDRIYVHDERFGEDFKLKVLARRASQYVYSDHLPYYS